MRIMNGIRKTILVGVAVLASHSVSPAATKAVDNLAQPKIVNTIGNLAADTLQSSKNKVVDFLEAETQINPIRIIDKAGKDITFEVQKIDSTIIQESGLDLYKVDSLVSVAKKETRHNLDTELLSTLDKTQKANYKDLVPGLSKRGYKALKRTLEKHFDMKTDTIKIGEAESAIIKKELKANNKKDILEALAKGNKGVDVYEGSTKYKMTLGGTFDEEASATVKASKNLPQKAEVAADSLNSAKNEIAASVKSDSTQMTIIDKITGRNLTPEIQALDSTILQKVGLDLSKVNERLEKLGQQIKDNFSTGLLSDIKNSNTVNELAPGGSKADKEFFAEAIREHFNADIKSDTIVKDSALLSKIDKETKLNNEHNLLNTLANGEESVELYVNSERKHIDPWGFITPEKEKSAKPLSKRQTERQERIAAREQRRTERQEKREATEFTNFELKTLLNNKDTTSMAKLLPGKTRISEKGVRIVGTYPQTILPLGPRQRSVVLGILEKTDPEYLKTLKSAKSDSVSIKLPTLDSVKVADTVKADTLSSNKVLAQTSLKDSVSADSVNTIKPEVTVKATEATVATEKVANKTIKAGDSIILKDHGKKHDTVWGEASKLIRQETGRKATEQEVLKVTMKMMKDNNITWETATRLPDGTKIKVSNDVMLTVAAMSAGGAGVAVAN